MRHLLCVLAFLMASVAHADTSTSVRAGPWSCGSTWDVPPNRDRDVRIIHDVVIDGGECKRLDIASGTSTLTGDLHAYNGSVVIRAAKLVGDRGRILFHVSNDRLFIGNTAPGPVPGDPDDHSDTDFGLWCMDGSTTQLVGAEVTPWLNALPIGDDFSNGLYGIRNYPTIAEGLATLAKAPVGWQTNDTLLIVGVNGTSALGVLSSIDGAKVAFTGGIDAVSLFCEGRWVRPKIANLSRRLVIASADVKPNDYNHRAHTVCMGHVTTRFENVEFRDLGPRAKLGRYPIHFHHSHTIGECVAERCSFWQSCGDNGSRFASIHNTAEVRLVSNVGYRSQGHGYFMEQGTEIENEVTGNLSVKVDSPEELPVRDSDISPGTHHYWTRSNNVLNGNVAAGGTAAVGLVAMPHSLKPTPQKPLDIQDFEALGIVKYGYWGRAMPLTTTRVVTAYCGTSGLGDGAKLQVLKSPTMLMCGELDATYSSQIYASSGGFTCDDGVLAGKVAIDLHYAQRFSLTNSKIRCKFAIVPTYWEVAGPVSDCNIMTERLFSGAYPRRRVSPGMIRIQNMTGMADGKSYPDTAKLTADFTRGDDPAMDHVLPGTLYSQHCRRLTAAAPVTGFVKNPPGTALYTSTWAVAAVGAVPANLLPLREEQAAWAGATADLGYYHGMPPGRYAVKYVTQAGVVKDYPDVQVLAGQVTILP